MTIESLPLAFPEDFSCDEQVDMVALKTIVDNWDHFKDKVGHFIDAKKGYQYVAAEAAETIVKEYFKSKTKLTTMFYKYNKGKAEGRRFSCKKTKQHAFSLQNLSRPLRHTISSNLYYDIDIVNCHPEIFKQMLDRLEFKSDAIAYYNEHRDQCLLELQTLCNITRDEAKRIPLSILNGGCPKWKSTEEVPDWLQNYIDQVVMNRDRILALPQYKSYLTSAKKSKKPSKWGEVFNVEGTAINHVFLKYENETLSKIISQCKEDNIRIGALCYDGLMIYKGTRTIDEVNNYCKKLEQIVEDHTGFKFKIKVKEMTEGFSLDGKVPNEVKIADEMTYSNVKERFEQNHFKCINESCFYEIDGDNIIIREKAKLLVAFEEWEYEEVLDDNIVKSKFIKRWLKDPHLRKYRTVALMPPPMYVPNDTFNLWTGFRVQKLETNESSDVDEEDLEVILEFISYLVNKVPEYNTYLLKYLAHIFQKPAELPVQSLVFRSQEGFGKGTFYDLLKLMIGTNYCFQSVNIKSEVFGEHAVLQAGKIIVNFDESTSRQNDEINERVKGMVSNLDMNINPKNQAPKTVSCFTRLILFSNNDTPWDIKATDRRFTLFDINPKTKPSYNYFKRLRKAMSNNNALVMLFNKLVTEDISSFVPERDRPETDFFQEVKEASRSLELEFMVDWIGKNDQDVKIKAGTLFKLFSKWIEDNTLNVTAKFTIQKLGAAIRGMKIDGFDIDKGRDANYYVFTKAGNDSWWKKQNGNKSLRHNLSGK